MARVTPKQQKLGQRATGSVSVPAARWSAKPSCAASFADRPWSQVAASSARARWSVTRIGQWARRSRPGSRAPDQRPDVAHRIDADEVPAVSRIKNSEALRHGHLQLVSHVAGPLRMATQVAHRRLPAATGGLPTNRSQVPRQTDSGQSARTSRSRRRAAPGPTAEGHLPMVRAPRLAAFGPRHSPATSVTRVRWLRRGHTSAAGRSPAVHPKIVRRPIGPRGCRDTHRAVPR